MVEITQIVDLSAESEKKIGEACALVFFLLTEVRLMCIVLASLMLRCFRHLRTDHQKRYPIPIPPEYFEEGLLRRARHMEGIKDDKH